MSQFENAGTPGLEHTWKPLLDREDVLILDTETTSFRPSDQIVEIAAIDTAGAVRLNSLVMPSGSGRIGADFIHGITRKVLRNGGARPWAHVAPDVTMLLRSAKGLLIWNAEYDLQMIQQTDFRYGVDPTVPDDLFVRCVMTDHQNAKGVGKLKEAADAVGGPEPKHRACQTAKAS